MKSSKSQKGYAVIEMGAIIAICFGYVLIVQTAYFFGIKPTIATDIDWISVEAKAQKGNSPNYAGLSFSGLCADGYLEESMCGENNDGVSSNPFGGDWSVQASDIYGETHIMVTITGIEDGRFMDLADMLAMHSYKACRKADDCASIILKAPSEDSNNGEITVHI